jgi:hypothetical protein
VDQPGGAQGVAGALAAQVAVGHATKLMVDGGEDLVEPGAGDGAGRTRLGVWGGGHRGDTTRPIGRAARPMSRSGPIFGFDSNEGTPGSGCCPFT